jgi:predicted cobalt transporter CbtA
MARLVAEVSEARALAAAESAALPAVGVAAAEEEQEEEQEEQEQGEEQEGEEAGQESAQAAVGPALLLMALFPLSPAALSWLRVILRVLAQRALARAQRARHPAISQCLARRQRVLRAR